MGIPYFHNGKTTQPSKWEGVTPSQKVTHDIKDIPSERISFAFRFKISAKCKEDWPGTDLSPLPTHDNFNVHAVFELNIQCCP